MTLPLKVRAIFLSAVSRAIQEAPGRGKTSEMCSTLIVCVNWKCADVQLPKHLNATHRLIQNVYPSCSSAPQALQDALSGGFAVEAARRADVCVHLAYLSGQQRGVIEGLVENVDSSASFQDIGTLCQHVQQLQTGMACIVLDMTHVGNDDLLQLYGGATNKMLVATHAAPGNMHACAVVPKHVVVPLPVNAAYLVTAFVGTLGVDTTQMPLWNIPRASLSWYRHTARSGWYCMIRVLVDGDVYTLVRVAQTQQYAELCESLARFPASSDGWVVSRESQPETRLGDGWLATADAANVFVRALSTARDAKQRIDTSFELPDPCEDACAHAAGAQTTNPDTHSAQVEDDKDTGELIDHVSVATSADSTANHIAKSGSALPGAYAAVVRKDKGFFNAIDADIGLDAASAYTMIVHEDDSVLQLAGLITPELMVHLARANATVPRVDGATIPIALHGSYVRVANMRVKTATAIYIGNRLLYATAASGTRPSVARGSVHKFARLCIARRGPHWE